MDIEAEQKMFEYWLAKCGKFISGPKKNSFAAFQAGIVVATPDFEPLPENYKPLSEPLTAGQRMTLMRQLDSGDTLAALAALAAQQQEPVPVPQGHNDDVVYAIIFDDYERKHEIIIGESAARARFKRISDSWNAHLFGKIETNSRDSMYTNNNFTPPEDQAHSERDTKIQAHPTPEGYPVEGIFGAPSDPMLSSDMPMTATHAENVSINSSIENISEIADPALSDEEIGEWFADWFGRFPHDHEQSFTEERIKEAGRALLAKATNG